MNGKRVFLSVHYYIVPIKHRLKKHAVGIVSKVKGIGIFVEVTLREYKYISQFRKVLLSCLILFYLPGRGQIQDREEQSQRNLSFYLYEAGDTFDCKIMQSVKGELLTMHSFSSGKKLGYLRTKGDSVIYQIDFHRKQYKKQAVTTRLSTEVAKSMPKKGKKNLILTHLSDTLSLLNCKTDSSSTGTLNSLSLRYSGWPAGLIPQMLLAEKIIWQNKQVVLDRLAFNLTKLEPDFFVLPVEYEERKSVYRASPD